MLTVSFFNHFQIEIHNLKIKKLKSFSGIFTSNNGNFWEVSGQHYLKIHNIKDLFLWGHCMEGNFRI